MHTAARKADNEHTTAEAEKVKLLRMKPIIAEPEAVPSQKKELLIPITVPLASVFNCVISTCITEKDAPPAPNHKKISIAVI